jgi:hypothetical protein
LRPGIAPARSAAWIARGIDLVLVLVLVLDLVVDVDRSTSWTAGRVDGNRNPVAQPGFRWGPAVGDRHPGAPLAGISEIRKKFQSRRFPPSFRWGIFLRAAKGQRVILQVLPNPV